MDNTDFEKSITHDLVNSVEYLSRSVVTRSILRQNTGTVSISSFDMGETQQTKYSPYDHLIQIIDGEAFISIDEKSNTVETGQAIIIPAHVKHWIRANKRFKMLSTIIKSGYEDISI
ncbi:cupin domain-containing protein [Algoriphagus chordae]|uniref:Quercetin dioxygenase-like cupin family protein n=1 Tax=Algoriphagus chordae TaxID=237019 RepID=A0A2W7QZT5_9BACT|nr:cupin domain-containing protein [Algoriphagus chordae]PZX54058.1 quercetin dioxygenase-like cupin family protein [Algoriphagus chordae]